MSDPSADVTGLVGFDPKNARTEEIAARKEEIKAKIGQSKFFSRGIGLEFKLENGLSYRGQLRMSMQRNKEVNYALFSGNNLFLLNAIEKNGNVVRDFNGNDDKIDILDIDMSTFRIIPSSEVSLNNKRDMLRMVSDEIAGKGVDDLSKITIKVDDNMDDKFPVPIVFQHESVDRVVPVSEPILADTLITEMPAQKDSAAFVAKKKELGDITTENKDLLEGSKLLPSIEKVLAKDTQSELKGRYDALKETIKAPVAQLNKTLESNLAKIAADHNSVIKARVEKTIAATKETRRKYKLELQKTRKQVADRLAGKSKGPLGLLKSSKLQNLEKSLNKDEIEIDRELGNAKRYVGVKERLLKWVDGSADKSKLTEEQIEAIVEAFNIDKYETACPNFIENMNGNTMEFIAFMLRELQTPLVGFGKTEYQKQSHEYIVFRDIVIKFLNSIIKMSSVSATTIDTTTDLQKLLSTTISSYEENMADNYFTPMILFNIKKNLLEILDEAIPILPKEDSDDDSEGTAKTTNSSNSVSSTKSAADKRREQQKKAAQQTLQELDRITPQINKVKMAVSNTIPNIALGAVLLYTERDVKNLLGRKTGESKEKHYYLDVDGKVKKIGSNMTYKLSINADGSIPPQLAHLGTVKQAPTDSLSGVNTADIYGSDKSLSSFMESPQALNYSGRSDSTKSSSKSLNLVKLGSESNVSDSGKSGEVYYGPEPPPKRSFFNLVRSGVKGLGNITRMRTSSKNTQGGKRRTRKFRKNKTHKRHSRR